MSSSSGRDRKAGQKAVALKNKNESLQQRIQNLRSIDAHQAKLNNTSTDQDADREQVDTREQELLMQKLEQQRTRLQQLKAKKESLLATADKLESEISGHV